MEIQIKHFMRSVFVAAAFCAASSANAVVSTDDPFGGGGGGGSTPVTSVTCGMSTATVGNTGYQACQGPISGNIAPGQTNTASFASLTYNLVGKSDDALFGPFSSNPSGSTSGTLSFDTAQKGLFVLGIKGGPDYSLYLFNGGSSGITSLNWDTLGITTGGGKAGPGLSHFALFTSTTPIPEPETYALMLAGLGVIGFIARRRKQQA